MINDEQFAKLPRYVRMEITRLRQDNEDFRAKLEAGPEDSNTFVDSFSTEKPLGKFEPIKFVLSRRENGSVDGYIDARLEDNGSVRITGTGGRGGLIVKPEASNSIKVTVQHDR